MVDAPKVKLEGAAAIDPKPVTAEFCTGIEAPNVKGTEVAGAAGAPNIVVVVEGLVNEN